MAEPHRPVRAAIERLTSPPGVGRAVQVIETDERSGERLERLPMIGTAFENGAGVPRSRRELARSEALAGDRQQTVIAE